MNTELWRSIKLAGLAFLYIHLNRVETKKLLYYRRSTAHFTLLCLGLTTPFLNPSTYPPLPYLRPSPRLIPEKLQMDAAGTEIPCPFVTAAQLNTLVHKCVVIAGKVLSATDKTILIDAGDGNNITVNRSHPIFVHVDVSCHVLVRGVVNPDLTINESPTFPPTVLGDKFGKYRTAFSVSYNFRKSQFFSEGVRTVLTPSMRIPHPTTKSFTSSMTPTFRSHPCVDPKLYNDAAAVTCDIQFVHMFN